MSARDICPKCGEMYSLHNFKNCAGYEEPKPMSEIEKAAKEYADRFFKSKEDCFKAGAAWKDAKVEKLVDCVKEILEILDDHEARKQMDSFTGQPLQIALAEYEGKP